MLFDIFNKITTKKNVIGAVVSTAALMLLTTIHHMYGAMIYDTPWRNHVAYVSLWSTFFIGISLAVFYKKKSTVLGTLSYWAGLLAMIIIPAGWIWLFESVYSHLLKNVLYFGGAPSSVLNFLFPPSVYHMPNNVIFELTGNLQVVVGLGVVYFVYQLLQRRRQMPKAEYAS